MPGRSYRKSERTVVACCYNGAFPRAAIPVGSAEPQVRGHPADEGSRLPPRPFGSFLEDPLLSGMLAAKQTKEAHAAIQGQLMDKLRAEAAVAKEKGEELQAARSLLGPKLPTLKADLLRLAALLRVTVVPRRSKRSSRRFAGWWAHCGARRRRHLHRSSFGAPVLPVPARELRQDALARLGRWLPNQAPSLLRPSCWRPAQVNQMMESRDQSMQTMLAQALQHMMTMVPQPANNPLTGDGPLSPESDMGFQTVEQQVEDLQDQEEL